MKSFKYFLILILASTIITAQTDEFSIENYTEFLNSHQDLTYDQFLEMHNAGLFNEHINTPVNSALYYDSIKTKYQLTAYEESLIDEHGFMVSERLQAPSFGGLLLDIWHKDLPVFVSTDALLFTFHTSFDKILKHTELQYFIPRMQELLNQMHAAMPQLEENYSDQPEMQQYLKDVDLYISVARELFSHTANPYYDENASAIWQFINWIESTNPTPRTINFFSSIPRDVDFSQFKPRGHYTDEDHPELAEYFRALMWLGRMELYLLPPQALNPPTDEDVKRQTIISFLVKEMIELCGSHDLFNQLESTYNFITGEQDNVTLNKLYELSDELSITQSSDLLDDAQFAEFQDTLSTKSYAFQRIMSQILYTDPMSPDNIVPASSFLLFGQRFIVDSYVTGNVVYDKIEFNGTNITRMLPNTLDILFSLGNDAAAQLLQDELEQYHYSSNLAALRYLIDAYNEDDWSSSLYNSWLNAIRQLNPSTDRTTLPQFMQTAAWWQEKMNTQLASWSELRHDYLLYGKQSYTGGIICSFPFSFVEPVPEFYEAMKTLAANCNTVFSNIDYESPEWGEFFSEYFLRIQGTYDTLETIAQKELVGITFTENEEEFLSKMIFIDATCGAEYSGWYPKLFFDYMDYENGFFKQDYITADYHTAPTDENGMTVGWVNHAGTGPVDMAVIIAENQNGDETAFIGPVLSYYELTTTNFLRLNDDEWAETYLQTANRPDWVNIYLANESGESRGDGRVLLTSVEETPGESIPVQYLTAQNYPNPFNASTIINFHIPPNLSGERTSLKIYDINGEEIKVLLDRNLPAGNYLTNWDGTNLTGRPVSSGVYFYRINCGKTMFSGKMILMK